MLRCRSCLIKSMRVLNLSVTICGIGMIIYSLWFLKKWKEGIAQLPHSAPIPKPGFILICLGVGIVVSLITLTSHIVVNCFNNSALLLYIISVIVVLLLEVAVIFNIFFRMNCEVELDKYIDKNHTKFRSFILFNFNVCRLILIMVLIPQINAAALSIALWFVGSDPRSTLYDHLQVPDFRQSFLVVPNLPISSDSRLQPRCEVSPGENPHESFDTV